MFNKMTKMKSARIWLFLVFLISGCANISTVNTPSHQSYCNLVRQTIDLDKLQQYYHIDTFPDRSPLVVGVREKGDVSCTELTKFGKPVKIVDLVKASNQEYKNYLELTRIKVVTDHAMVNFKYDPEGLQGEITFKKYNSEWMIEQSTLVEL